MTDEAGAGTTGKLARVDPRTRRSRGGVCLGPIDLLYPRCSEAVLVRSPRR
jgi:hypothetical protein